MPGYAVVALNFAYYNFVKTHGALRMTPAMAAGIEKSYWTVAELVERCGATWRESVSVHEIFRDQTVWKGEVKVFDLNGHPKAKRCDGWSHPEGENDKGERFVTVLEIPPVESAITAVRASIVADSKRKI